LKGPSIASDFWPDSVVSEAARLGASDGTPAAAAREAGRRRKRLQRAVKVFKAQVKLVWTNILAEEDDECRAGLHQRMRLALHQVAVCRCCWDWDRRRASTCVGRSSTGP